MKIAIVSDGGLPIPAIKGGAVETLIDAFVMENEQNEIMDIDVYSTDDPTARGEGEKFNKTRFIYVSSDYKVEKIWLYCLRLLERFLGNGYLSKYRFEAIVNGAGRKIGLWKRSSRHYFIKNVINKMKKEKYDVIVIENRKDYVNYVKNVSNKSKIVLHIHNVTYFKNQKADREILDHIDRVVAVSEFVKKEALRDLKEYQSKFFVLKNCADLQKETNIQIREETRMKYNIKSSDIVILFVGRLDPEKGCGELLQAFNKLNKLNLKLLIVGGYWFSVKDENEFVKQLRDIARKNRDKIIFTGYISHKYLSRIYQCSDIVVIPSICEDAAPLVLIESMMAGKATIITDSGGMPEYSDNHSSVIVKRKDLMNGLVASMETLIDDADLRNRMADEAEKTARNYTKEFYYKNFVHIMMN